MNRPQLITDQQEWNRIAVNLAQEPELAIDTEANSMYAYRGRICLIQIGTSDNSYLVDPLAVEDLSALGTLLENPEIIKVLHGSDYDLRSFYRESRFKTLSLFDTEISARFLGVLTPNLGDVLRIFLDVEIPKSRKLQRSDWGQRPLSPPAIDYAASDVLYLIPLAEELRRRLAEAGRLDWVQEECVRLERVSSAVSDAAEPAFLRIKGNDRLDPQELAVLKELFEFREAEAERLDWPPYRVMRNETLIYIAQANHIPLEDVPDLSPQLVRRAGGRIREAIQRGRRGPGFQRPARPPRTQYMSREVQGRLQFLKQWRTEKGVSLGLDPALLWPAVSLERLAYSPERWEDETEESGAIEIRAWQRREFSEELAEVVANAAQRHPSSDSNS